MKINRAQLSLIHVAKSQLGLDEEEYRTILNSVCGVESSTKIKSHDDFKNLLKAFIKLGFNPEKAIRKTVAPRVSSASPAQLQHIRDLWLAVTNNPDDPNALNKFLQKRFKVDHVNVLPKQKALSVIEALKEMFYRKALVTIYESIYGDTRSAGELERIFKQFISKIGADELRLTLAAIYAHDDKVAAHINKTFITVKQNEVNHARNQKD